MSAKNSDAIYELIEVPGADNIQILAVSRSTSQFHYTDVGSKSPWWMISMKRAEKKNSKTKKDILFSSLEGKENDKIKYENFAELYGFFIDAYRATNTDITNQLFTSAMIRHDDCIVLIPNGIYVADIENAQLTGKPFDIVIICIGWIQGELHMYQKIEFKNAYVLSVNQALDRAFIRFRVQTKTWTFIPYTQEGEKKGQAICEVDFSKNSNKITKGSFT